MAHSLTIVVYALKEAQIILKIVIKIVMVIALEKPLQMIVVYVQKETLGMQKIAIKIVQVFVLGMDFMMHARFVMDIIYLALIKFLSMVQLIFMLT